IPSARSSRLDAHALNNTENRASSHTREATLGSSTNNIVKRSEQRKFGRIKLRVRQRAATGSFAIVLCSMMSQAKRLAFFLLTCGRDSALFLTTICLVRRTVQSYAELALFPPR